MFFNISVCELNRMRDLPKDMLEIIVSFVDDIILKNCDQCAVLHILNKTHVRMCANKYCRKFLFCWMLSWTKNQMQGTFFLYVLTSFRKQYHALKNKYTKQTPAKS